MNLTVIGSHFEIVHQSLPIDDPRQHQPDITLARERLAWEPKVPMRARLKQTTAYFGRLLNEGWGQGRAVA